MIFPDDKPHWFVAYVYSCRERKASEELAAMGVAYYLPIQKVRRKWSDRTKIVDKLVLPRIIFVHSTYRERLLTLQNCKSLRSYITTGGPHTPAVVPDAEMETFIAMVDSCFDEVVVTDQKLHPGERVVVTAGPLRGMEFELTTIHGRTCIASSLGKLGTATVAFDASIIKKVTP